jgi:CBS domain-containing protein
MSRFDLTPVAGSRSLAGELRAHAAKALARDPNFVPLVANDALANLPPLTFFQGLVVDDAGNRSEVLDIGRCALQPLTDVARVLALARGDLDPAATCDRLAAAAAALPGRESLFRDALEGFRVALLHAARAVLRSGSGAGAIDPSTLDKYDQQLLKSTFRAILELLEFTARHFDLAPRR